MLDKTYSPADIEPRIHAAWEKADAFKAGRPDMTAAERAKAEPYCIVIPPPNVTGSLHMGHALNNTIQDVLCRFERMRGKDVLWQPGTDHAGIATQLVVSRQLAERQIDYKSLGREKFLEKVWEWKAQSGGTIIGQLKRLGASCDWSRERFTMDEGLSKAVLKVFVDLANTPGPTPGRNLIYRDKRLVNWDPEFQSAISDLEVEPREHTGSFKWTRGEVDKEGNAVAFDGAKLAKVLAKDPSGHMYYIRYPLAGVAYDVNDPKTYLVVGTTRPETMLGDTGVAIHPENPKLKHLIGKKCVLPLCDREIAVVGDTYADPEKGTGAVKITPAHDFNDWEVGKRCKLPALNILDATGKVNENAPKAYQGLERFEARHKVVVDLVALDLVAKIEPHTHAVPHAQRGDAIVEPWLTDQWYVDAATLAKPAIEAVRAGKTRFVPEKYAADYYRWLENIQPWCISRQLWWGHQIPAWYGPDGQTFIALDEAEAQAKAKAHYASSPSPRARGEGRGEAALSARGEGQPQTAAPAPAPHPSPLPVEGTGRGGIALTRDPDVLDTWFSSGLWPFSTLGWPEKTPELARYYPTSCLVTGFDIIFFWVARMMMQGLAFMKDDAGKPLVPFHDVYIHGLVRDEKGRKMSKSIGNVIDPLDLIDTYGADALRFTMAALTTQGRDVKLSTQRIEGYRNFATKLWNATRFAEMNGCLGASGFAPKQAKQTVNRWIAGETERAARAVTAALEDYRFNDAAGAVYAFVWDVFCDWYIELIKPILNGTDEAAKAETKAAVAWALDQILALLHPFMPFITEELWEKTAETGRSRAKLLALSSWPKLSGIESAEADAEIGWLIRIVSDVRSVRTEMNVPAGAKVPLVLVGASAETKARAARHGELIQRLARADAISSAEVAPKGAAQIVVGETTVCLPLAGVIDLAGEGARLKREIAKMDAEIKKIDAKLANQSFVAKAPPEVVEEQHERRAASEEAVKKLTAALKRLEAAA